MARRSTPTPAATARLSYEHAGRIEAQLKAEVAELMAKAEAADRADLPDGMSIPDELARREERLAKLAEARAKIEARAKERFEREQAEHEAKLAAREAKTAADRQEAGRQAAPAADRRPAPTDQINLTDEQSRIMPVAGGGFEQCYNAQAAVAAGSLLVVATDVVQAPNDKQQLEPMLDRIESDPVVQVGFLRGKPQNDAIHHQEDDRIGVGCCDIPQGIQAEQREEHQRQQRSDWNWRRLGHPPDRHPQCAAGYCAAFEGQTVGQNQCQQQANDGPGKQANHIALRANVEGVRLIRLFCQRTSSCGRSARAGGQHGCILSEEGLERHS